MKNSHRFQGKRNFLFDDKELIMLGGGAVVICALIFVLGVMIGQSLEERSVASPIRPDQSLSPTEMAETGMPEQSGEMAAVNGEQTAAGQNESGDGATENGRSYYTVLPDQETYVEVTATPEAKEAASQAPIAPQEPVEETVETPPAARPVAPRAPLREDVPVPPQANRQATAAPVRNATVPALPNVPKSPSDEIRVGRQQAQPSAGNQAQAAPLPDGAIYSVQVASSQRREDAERLVQRFGANGFQAYVMEADLGTKGVWYRVRVGNFVKRDQAEEFKKELERTSSSMIKSPFVMKVAE